MSDRIAALRRHWTEFWLAPSGPENLAVCRILFFGAFFFYYLERDYTAWGQISPAFWMPIWLYKGLAFPSLTPELLNLIQFIWRTAVVFSCVGLFTRSSTIVSFIAGTFLLGLPNNFGMTNHSDGLVVIIMLIMAVSHCGDRWSVDRVLRRRFGKGSSPDRISGEYTWPVRAVWLMFSLIFFAAGVAKLRRAGLEWVFSDTMSILLISHHYHNPGSLLAVGLDIARDRILSKFLALATILLEIGYPLTLFHRKSRWVIVPAVFLMQVAIRYVMGPVFIPFLICNLFWVPWDRVIIAAQRWRSAVDPTSETGTAP